MKMLNPLALVLFLASAASAADVVDVRGEYVEARTATVFAGACHYGSEYTTIGREALLVWQLESGSIDGVSLAGITLGLIVASDRNLDIAEGNRRSVCFLPEGLTPDRGKAALRWLKEEHADVIGDLLEVKTACVEMKRTGDRYELRIGAKIELVGSLLANRDCCSQRHRVWYEPFDSTLRKPIVGEAELFRCANETLGRRWATRRVNCVFAGRFGSQPAG